MSEQMKIGDPVPNLWHIVATLEGLNKILQSGTLYRTVAYLRLLIQHFEAHPIEERKTNDQ